MASAPDTFKPDKRPSSTGAGLQCRPSESERRQSPGQGHRVKQLDFEQAMTDFRTMFPTMDDEVIEAVLRANNGAVDATIDQLLTMNIDNEDMTSITLPVKSQTPFIANHQSLMDQIEGIAPPSYDSTVRNNAPTSTSSVHRKHSPLEDQVDNTVSDTLPPNTLPPPPPRPARLTPRGSHHMSNLETDSAQTSVKSSLSPVHVSSTHISPSRQYKRWDPPILGSLPVDFLRIVLTQEQTRYVSNTPIPGNSNLSMHNSPSELQNGKSFGLSHRVSPAERHNREVRRLQKSQTMRETRPAQHSHSQNRHLFRRKTLSSQAIQKRMAENERQLKSTDRHLDPEMTQILEDERIALNLALQNQEFLQELRANQDFMRSLQRDRRLRQQTTSSSSDEECELLPPPPSQAQQTHRRQESFGRLELPVRLANDEDTSSDSSDVSPQLPRHISPSAESSTSSDGMVGYGEDRTEKLGAFPRTQPWGPIQTKKREEQEEQDYYGTPVKEQDDSEFKQQLKNMGSSSKRKVMQLAKRFFSRRRVGKQALRDTSAPSTINLLDDNDDEDVIDEQEEEERRRMHETPMFEPLPGAMISAHPNQHQNNDHLGYDAGGFHI